MSAIAAHHPDGARHRQSNSRRRSKYSVQDLYRSLEIIGEIPAPLPPDLPLSPPSSRASSPASSHLSASSSKRKLEDAAVPADLPLDGSKRFKSHKLHSSSSAGSLPPPPSTTASSSSSSSSPIAGPSSTHHTPAGHTASTLGGTAASSASHGPQPRPGVAVQQPPLDGPAGALTLHMPVRRPRRGKVTIPEFDKLHDSFHLEGRALKYSGDARFWSTYPPSHRHYKPLADPPPPGTPYHTHGGLMSRLELMDALLHFVYSLWTQDYARNRCAATNWTSIFQFLDWTKDKWSQESTIGAREKMFTGLLHMIEAFIYQRRVRYAVSSHVGSEVFKICNSLPNPKEIEKARSGSSNGQQRNPGMLPSPAGTASTNGTPNNPDNGTPNTVSADHEPTSSSQLPAPNLPPAVTVPLTAPVPQPLMWDIKDVVDSQNRAAIAMTVAHQHLTLPAMREHFPRTFGRMVYSTLTAQDEHEPDMKDDDGELFWPGQCVTGEGLGWLCNMGRAMVKEFGDEFGYKGLDGIIPKPDDERRAVPRS